MLAHVGEGERAAVIETWAPRAPWWMVCWLLAEQLERDPAFVVGFHYSSGLRVMEALRLRVNDLDLDRRELTARDGKGGKDRLTVLPESLVPALYKHGAKGCDECYRRPRGTKAASRHSFRHCQWLRHAGLRPGSATHLLERRQDIRTIQELLDHKEVSISLIDTHVLTAVRSGYEVQPTSWYWPNRWFSDP